MKTIAIIAALTLLGACAFNPERMFYEVTQRSANEVSIQVNKGNMSRQSQEMAQMLAYMDEMAIKECQGFGKSGAKFISERNNTSGAYYAWVERSYRCR